MRGYFIEGHFSQTITKAPHKLWQTLTKFDHPNSERKKHRKELLTELQHLEILASNLDIQKISFALGNTLSSIYQLNNNVPPINILQELLEKIN